MNKERVVAVSFQSAGKIFDFNAENLELKIGDKVVVETERGRALATVVIPPRDEESLSGGAKRKTIIRVADASDLDLAEKNAARELEALKFCKKRVKERNMEMKLVRAEYLFDGSKIVFFFTADGRVDFRELVRDLAQHFRTRIEMRQIGVRDEAKMVGGLGICGRELCCCTYLRGFAPVSVKMAKAQGLALNPSKISGQCGRLLCCLGYEYETYNDLRKNMPKCGKKVTLDSGPADVVSVNVLAQTVTVNEKGQRRDISLCELEGCSKHKPCGDAAETKEKSATKPAEKREEQSERRASRSKSNRRGGSRPSGSRSKSGSAEKGGPKEQHSKKQKSDTSETRGQDAQSKPTDNAEKTANKPRRRRRPRNRKKPSTPNPQSPDNSNG
ncbi:MAG: hypothetical protein C0618_04645 [Desulfuromonas sp.]|nr:MAG: hypothetical protein C0618_04645 [Desulfuromonas sp.]